MRGGKASFYRAKEITLAKFWFRMANPLLRNQDLRGRERKIGPD